MTYLTLSYKVLLKSNDLSYITQQLTNNWKDDAQLNTSRHTATMVIIMLIAFVTTTAYWIAYADTPAFL